MYIVRFIGLFFQGKEVLILGGGDGGLLKELLELPKGQVPAFITMVEIDEMVMTACSEFMPSVCGKYTKKENWEGPNYKVINGCAIQFMKDCQVENSYCKGPFIYYIITCRGGQKMPIFDYFQY